MLRKILKIPAGLCILVIKIVYQNGLGRLLPKVCIYEPSCSKYMIQALQIHGFIKGGMMGCWRILRCHPFARGGWDPVPGYDYDSYFRDLAAKENYTDNTDKDKQIEEQ